MTRFTTVSHPNLSLWLSAVHAVAKQSLNSDQSSETKCDQAAVLNHPMVQAAVRHVQSSATSKDPLSPQLSLPGFNDPQVHVSHLTFALANAQIYKTKEIRDEIEDKLFRLYSDRDPDWSKCIVRYMEYYGLGKKPHYNNWRVEGKENPNYSVIHNRLKNDARVGIIGDWGTGMEDALKLVEAMLNENVDAIIHLGDVYYSGTDAEFQHHIVDIFEQAMGHMDKRVPVFSIPGNHDYYAGAKGLYEQALNLNHHPDLEGWHQEASYFCLRTQDGMWQFLGMDTGLHGRSVFQDRPAHPVPSYLDESEVEWHYDKLNPKRFQGTTILLSHHQLFSQHNKLRDDSTEPWLNDHLLNTFRVYFDQIAVWFWGHEHNLALFKDGTYNLSKGRLIGCSAYEENGDPYAPVDSSYAEHVPYINTDTNWRVSPSFEDPGYFNHAFAILDFSRKNSRDPMRCTYYMFPSWGQTQPKNCTLKELYTEYIYPSHCQ
ncbi:metallophosphoesterase family protein [Alicyclobacillus dauci]|uniref:Metallophosphoesterase n=1 Tax=Alicyclobacillus dauci TaxID=1475485 RepID=A0ABY6YZW0_9BACL|nr:metallophosphoesterase [Alicyclobacillus dauci]WAH36154.1 metallophosphoesterase [Alicyclobacillus dauci]